ncbi:MAG: GGDEF domain-containing protein [Candidatus Aminicenantes bacterium]|nr:MAG: GGDEF domain-containing protein [Candidatus Aminicenantes bacterium]
MKCEVAKSSGLSFRQGLLLVLHLTLAALIFGQESFVRFEQISSKQGLSQNVVYAIEQDHQGFMWFGTQNGLNRFDGYIFKKYKTKPKDPSTLPENGVSVIYEDRSGSLWVGTFGGGLSLFNRERDNFIRFPYVNGSDPSPDPDIDVIYTFHEDRGGIFWIGTLGGLLRFDAKKQKWSRFAHQPEVPGTLSDNRIRAFCQDHRGIMWIGTEGGGLNAFNPKTGEFSHFFHQPGDPHSLSSNSVYVIFEDSKKNLWVGTQGGLDRLDRKAKTFIHYRYHHEKAGSLSNNRVISIFEDSQGRLWIGTDGGGLNRLKSLPEKTFVHYHHQLNNPNSLSHNRVLFMMEDDKGCLWIGTFGGGINRIDPQLQQFVHIIGNPNLPNSLNSNDVTCFYQDTEKYLWIGTFDGGLNRYNPGTGEFRLYKYSSVDAGSLSSNEVFAIHEDENGDLWIGTWLGGINRFNRETEKFTRYKHIDGTNKGPGSNNIFCFGEDQDENLWIGTRNGGLNLFLPGKNEFVYYENNPQDPRSISSNSVTYIYPDREQEELLWIGMYSSGLERFNRHTGYFRHYSHEPGNPNSLSHNYVLCIYISPHHQEIVWVGTLGGGLNKFNKKTNQWQLYTEEDGLSDNTIYGILEDSNKHLWLSSDRGLSRFNPGTEEFKNYFAEDGLQHNEFNQGAFHKGRDGRFYFGGINGFNVFVPEYISDNAHIPPVVITNFKLLTNRDFKLEKSILKTKEIRLSYRDTFSFEFAALNYTAPAKNRYAYKIEGLDEEWIPLDHKRDIIFTPLPPREYVFRVRGSNNDGLWNEEGVSIKLIISPPFWGTWWFKVLLALSAVGTLFVMYKLRVRRYKIQRKNLETEVAKRTQEIRQQKEIIEEKNKQLEVSNWGLKKSEMELRELNATKDKFFSIISHDLKNHLTALLGFSDMLSRSFDKLDQEKKHKYSRSIDRAAKDLYELLENLLQWSRSQIGVLQCKPGTFDLSILIPEVISVYIMNAKKKKVDLFYDIEKGTLAYADKNMVRTVLRNLISNAIKFTDRGGEVRVTANGGNNFVEVSVMDTGIGISSDSKHTLFKIGKTRSTKGTAREKGTGLGLILCKEFVEKNNGKIWFESPIPGGQGKGSIFRFTLPNQESGKSVDQ